MKKNNAWFKQFIDDCCELNDDLEEKSANLYTAYLNYCYDKLENIKNTHDFYSELEMMNLKRTTHKRARYFKGIKLNKDAYHLYITLGTIDFVKRGGQKNDATR